jgi:type II secretory pathway pseudopilin PulG
MRRARRTGRCRRAPRGYAYLGLLILVAIVGVTAAASAELGAIYQRRMAEKELLAVGNEFQRALMSFSSATPIGQPTQPRTLEELLRDPRYPNVVRHLRRIYEDPMTGKADWVLVKSPDGQTIVGIHSASHAHPIQVSQFSAAFQGFEKKKSYTDWVFVARFPALTQGARPVDPAATNGVAPGGSNGGGASSGDSPFGGSPSGGSPFGGSPFGGSQPGSSQPNGGGPFDGNSSNGLSPGGSLFNNSPFGGASSNGGQSDRTDGGSSQP